MRMILWLPSLKSIKCWKMLLICSAVLLNLNIYLYITKEQYYVIYETLSSPLCTNEILSEIVKSQNTWFAFIDILNNVHDTNMSSSQATQISTESFLLTHFSVSLINKTIKLLDFKNHLKMLPKATNTTYHFNEIYNEVIQDRNRSYNKDNKLVHAKHYPTYFNINEYLNALPVGFPPNEVPINNNHLFVVETPRSACNPCHGKTEKLDLLVLIKSCIYCFEHRSYARKTYMNMSHWKNFTIRFVFVVGLPTPNETDIYHFDGVDIRLNGRSWSESIKYESSRWSAINKLRNESRNYGDMLVGGFYDNYFNLTTKMMLTFRWACVFCRNATPLVLFIDDDYLLHPNNTVKFVNSLKRSDMKYYAGGPMHSTQIVFRPQINTHSSKWALSTHEYPWDYYPPYFFGIGYILGADLVCDASVVMSFTQSIRVDDAYLGIVLARLNKMLNNVRQFKVVSDTNFEESGAVVIEKFKGDQLFA